MRKVFRRMVEGQARPDAPQRAVERGLRSLGIAPGEAAEIAAETISACASEQPAA